MGIIRECCLTAAAVLAAGMTAPAAALGPPGGDMTFCQLYGLYQAGRQGDVVGLAVGTTSWNVGTADLMWFAIPNEQHPFIAMNLYRLKADRFEQIGQSWAKHGFFALGSEQCNTDCTFEPGHAAGSWLGVGCTDTYSPQLNAGQTLLGPRYEINPWTGSWTYAGSHISNPNIVHTPIEHRLQVRDADLDPALNESARYFVEAYYVIADDTNHMNSAAWKEVYIQGENEQSVWQFEMSGATSPPQIGFAINAWTDAQQSTIAEEIPPVEFLSPDGRCILTAKAVFLGQGRWRYQYAILNVDMDRQVSAFNVPVTPSATITDVQFQAVQHHDEESAGYRNTPWDHVVQPDRVSWFTVNNPIRWGTMYTFSFMANSAPGQVSANIGLRKPGTPQHLTTTTVAPTHVPPVCGDNIVETGEDCDPPDGLHCDAFCEWICGDGVLQPGEECDPPDGIICDDNCQIIQICGDGILVHPEQCDPPDGIDCSNLCLPIIRCGNGVVEGGEECDDGNNASGDGCDKHCRSDFNNACADALPIYDGLTPFSTIGATTDGPTEFACNPNTNVYNDIWFDYTAICTGQLQVTSLCTSATFNTHLFVYNGCTCPTGFGFVPGCGMNPPGCALGSTTTLHAEYGNCYRIRVGGFTQSGTGTGLLQITCNGAPPVCGNSLLELNESCDDGNTTPGDGCSPFCQWEPPANDACTRAAPIGEGQYPFSTLGAETDGPTEPTQCFASGTADVEADIWFCYTASRTGPVSLQVCDADFDTKVAVYDGCTCPTDPAAIACNDDACQLGSAININVIEGQSYLIRVGGFHAETGVGTLELTLLDIPAGDPLRGGQLYDSWWHVTGAAEPTGTHPLYPPQGTQSGPDTFRCVECHGWDYEGAGGQYAAGPHYTGIPGVLGTQLTPSELFQLLSLQTVPNGHDFKKYGLTDEDLFDLIQFLSDLTIDTNAYIDPAANFNGNPATGQMLYQSGPVACIACHGPDGTQINFGTSENPQWVGTVATYDPWQFLHKVRFAQPGTNMPSLLAEGGTNAQAADLGAHGQQNLPADCLTAIHCDDTLACTGEETCHEGTCKSNPPPFADLDLDGDTDLHDFAHFTNCYTNPCTTQSCEPPLYTNPCCQIADQEPDGDVDLDDAASFAAALTGPS